MKKQTKTSVYLSTVSIIGLLLLIVAIIKIPHLNDTDEINLMIYLMITAAIAQLMIVTDSDRFFDVGTAIALSGGVLFGPNACTLIICVCLVTRSTIQFITKQHPLPRILSRLGFNFGMLSCSGFLATSTYLTIIRFSTTWWWFVISWLITSLVFTFFNVLFMVTLFRIRKGLSLKRYWQMSRWSHLIDFGINGLGAGMFTMAIFLTGALGVMVFSFPLLLTFFAFRLQVRESNIQKERLEAVIAERTQELSQSNQELTAVIARKNRFTSILSHDMKTPLTAILLYAQMLKTMPKITDEKRHKIADTIVTSGNALNDLVLNIIDVEALETDTEPKVIKRKVEMNEIVKSAVTAIELQALHKQISVTFEELADAIFVDGDRHILLRIATNLLSNAVKYTPSNGTIVASINSVAGQAVFKVQDSGYGIPKEQIDSIFKPYHRVEDNNQYASGTGLGLSVVNYFVAAHDGRVDVESEVGKGSLFTVTLPLSGTAPVAAVADQSRAQHDVASAKKVQPDSPASLPHHPQNGSTVPKKSRTGAPKPATQL